MKKLLQSLFFLVFVAFGAMAQERTITGTVTAQEDGLPIPGVTVRVKEAVRVGAVTDAKGQFTIKVPENAKNFVFSFLGYNTQELPISNNMKVALTSDYRTLNEVVVTAGGVNIQRREQGNQATTVKGEELTQGKATNVAAALSGKVAGLQVNAVSSGVNPSVRLVLRGNRSLLGNNQALVVVDNVIVPSSILGNLNAEDIEDIQVLNGAGAAALYGSDASNGALIITTKRGKSGPVQIRVSHTTTFETASYLPKIQKRFGSGTGPDDIPTYTPYENQQYGPAFDGSLRQIGKPLIDGSIQTVPYAFNSSENKNAFWETGIGNQEDISISSGDEKSTYYISGQYFEQTATMPGDKYNRFTLRLNGTRKLAENLDFNFSANYVQNRYNLTTQTNSMFDQVLQTPGQIPLTRYKDWQTDPFANPNGYYNEYYHNPYFTLDNNRQLVRNDYLTGNVQLKYRPIDPLSILFRVGLSTRNTSNKSWTNSFTYSDYRLGLTSNFQNITGSVGDGATYSTQLMPELQVQYQENLNEDFSINTILGATVRENQGKALNIAANNLVVPDLFNVSNTVQNNTGGESNVKARQIGVYADVRLGYKEYLYLHLTGRNDWRSVLSQANWSLFYPAADVSFIASDAIPFLKNSKVIQSLKIRGGVSKVGYVNLDPYALQTTFGQAYGYPYSGNPGLSVGNTVVSQNIKPEVTTQVEAGFDLELLKSRISTSFTFYQSNTVDQTIPTQIPSTTGFTRFLTNTGEVQNTGIETSVRFVPLRIPDGIELSVGANYTYNANKVLSISSDQNFISLGTFGAAQIAAEVGSPFPLLKGTTYKKDDQGRVIVDRITGLPSVTTEVSTLGYTEPRHRLGLDMQIEYKGFRFATVWEYRTGNVMYYGANSYDFSGAGIRTTYFNRERFVVPNSSYLDPATNTYVANTNITTRTGGVDFWTNGPTNTGVASNYAYSAAFWKLREASLSYDLPQSFLSQVKFVKKARVSIQGRNLLLFAPKTNLYTDPEYSAYSADNNAIGFASLGQTPPGRYFGFSLEITL